VVLDAQWGGGVSKNPYLAFRVKGAKAGDEFEVSWTDNTGKSESGKGKVA